jgi:hypothetical protein
MTAEPVFVCTPVRCTRPGCHWAVHGIPTAATAGRQAALDEHTAAEHDATGPTETPETTLADRIEQALRDAARTHPCTCGSTTWASCYHDGRLGSHEARRAAAVLAVVQPELDAARAENDRLRQQLAGAQNATLTEAADTEPTVGRCGFCYMPHTDCRC